MATAGIAPVSAPAVAAADIFALAAPALSDFPAVIFEDLARPVLPPLSSRKRFTAFAKPFAGATPLAGLAAIAELGLAARWYDPAISQELSEAAMRPVGNDGESFERNSGRGSPLGIERGLNTLRTRGDLHDAPPMR